MSMLVNKSVSELLLHHVGTGLYVIFHSFSCSDSLSSVPPANEDRLPPSCPSPSCDIPHPRRPHSPNSALVPCGPASTRPIWRWVTTGPSLTACTADWAWRRRDGSRSTRRSRHNRGRHGCLFPAVPPHSRGATAIAVHRCAQTPTVGRQLTWALYKLYSVK